MPRLNHERIAFTKTKLSTLPVVNKPTGYYDTEVRQLCLRVSPNGKKTFTVITRYNGRPDKIKLGTFPNMSVENARKAAIKTLAELDDGKHPREAKRRKLQEITFGRYFEDHYCATSTKQTLCDDKAYYRRYLKDWENKRLSDIKTTDVRTMHASLSHIPCGANHALVLVRTMYNRAINDQIFHGINPTSGIKKYPTEAREKILTEKEIGYFIAAVQADKERVAANFYLLLLLIGQRKMNTLQMRWEQIDFDAAVWKIPKTKNGKPHTAYLTADALKILKEMHAERWSDWVFPSLIKQGEHMWEPRKVWSRILRRTRLFELADELAAHYDWNEATVQNRKQCLDEDIDHKIDVLEYLAANASISMAHMGIKNFRIHDLRRTFGSQLAADGASLLVIGKALGHKSQSSTAVYARLADKSVRQAVDSAMQRIAI